ncbi:MAG: DUF3828 domain-containing protein [Anaerolineae bacterium]|nr:DUF3828 domain-containing protein [Anaerolineae bacterium]
MQRLLSIHLRGAALGLALLVMMLTLAGARPVQAESRTAFSAIDAKIEIVWPHGNAPVSQASLVNITAYLFEQNTRNSVPCDLGNTVRLWRALNNQPAQQVATGSRRTITQGGVTFPVWDFNNVDVSAARDGGNKYYFYVTVDGITTTFNIWSHGADARTYLPDPVQPTSSGGIDGPVDARIQVVWPHDEAGRPRPVNSATQANITVALFRQGAQQSVSPDFNQRVILLRSLNNGVVDTVGAGVRRIVRQGGVTYPVWDFNDVDVWAAQDALSKYYFRVLVQDTQTFSTVWSHGVDARTYFPSPDQPQQGCGGQPTAETPQAVVNAFYTWYLSYQGNPLVDHIYRNSAYVAPGFVQKVDSIVASTPGGYDPILCAQARPAQFTTELLNLQPPQSLVGVRTNIPGHSFQVALNTMGGNWKISDVTCSPTSGAATFTSQRLGISFDYLSSEAGVQESGDRVYVYGLNTPPANGQWVQVYRKAPTTSLEDAIRAQVLQGYSPQDCFVVRSQDPVPGQTNPPTYQFARIDVPHQPGDGPGVLQTAAAKCPQPYAAVGGIAYFLADTAHPDRFVFFSIGQYGIPAGNGRVWQQTLRFLDQ